MSYFGFIICWPYDPLVLLLHCSMTDSLSSDDSVEMSNCGVLE